MGQKSRVKKANRLAEVDAASIKESFKNKKAESGQLYHFSY